MIKFQPKEVIHEVQARCLCCTEPCKDFEEIIITEHEIQNVSGNWAISIDKLKQILKHGGHI